MYGMGSNELIRYAKFRYKEQHLDYQQGIQDIVYVI